MCVNFGGELFREHFGGERHHCGCRDRQVFRVSEAVVIGISRGVVIRESLSSRVQLFQYSVRPSTFQYLFAGKSYLP